MEATHPSFTPTQTQINTTLNTSCKCCTSSKQHFLKCSIKKLTRLCLHISGLVHTFGGIFYKHDFYQRLLGLLSTCKHFFRSLEVELFGKLLPKWRFSESIAFLLLRGQETRVFSLACPFCLTPSFICTFFPLLKQKRINGRHNKNSPIFNHSYTTFDIYQEKRTSTPPLHWRWKVLDGIFLCFINFISQYNI